MNEQKPNVLIIYPDQMRADAMSCAGNPVIKTPNFDRVANEGVRFEQAFTSFPLCCPFRASVFTGKYAHSHGMFANHFPLPLDQEFLPAILQRKGYRTGYFGKWHLNGGPKHSYVKPEERLGFERFIGFSRGHAHARSIFYRDNDETPRVSNRYEPDYQTDHLIEFIEDASEDSEGRPFFGTVCFGPPHTPLDASDCWLNLYSPDEVPVIEDAYDSPEDIPESCEFLAKYYGQIANIDYNIGRLLNCLDRNGLADNTLLIVVSDHGDMAGEHGKYGKKTPYDSSMRVPFLIRYPKEFKAGRVATGLVDAGVDLMPTILDLCGIEAPEGVQGTSFLPILRDEAESVRNEVFYEVMMMKEGEEKFPIPERGVRTRDRLFVRTPEGPKLFFDLENDPAESNNLAESASHKEEIAEFNRILKRHMQAINDAWEIEAIYPPPNYQTHTERGTYKEEIYKKAVPEN